MCAAVVAECCLLLRNLHRPAKPHPPQTACPALPQPPVQAPHTCRTLQRLHSTLQCPMTCPGLPTHTLAGLCALWLPSAASSSGNLHKPTKPQPPQTTCPALPQPPVQAPPHLVLAAEAVFDAAVPHCMPRAGHSHTGTVLCAVVAKQHLHICLANSSIQKNRIQPQTTCPARSEHPVQLPPHLLRTAEPALNLAVAHGMLRANQEHTVRSLCAVVFE